MIEGFLIYMIIRLGMDIIEMRKKDGMMEK